MAFPTPDAVTGLYAAVVSVAGGVLTWWLNRHGERPARKTAWQRQAETLRNELRKLYQDQIADLKKQLADANAEVRRLNRLLNRERNDGDGDT